MKPIKRFIYDSVGDISQAVSNYIIASNGYVIYTHPKNMIYSRVNNLVSDYLLIQKTNTKKKMKKHVDFPKT